LPCCNSSGVPQHGPELGAYDVGIGTDRIKKVPLPLVQPRTPLRITHPTEPIHRIVDTPRLIALWHLASLDAPTVAVAWALGFAWPQDSRLSWPVLLILALVTWAIYVTDRLLDARAGMGSSARAALRERHFFHWRHRRLLAPLAAGAACCAAGFAVASISSIVFERGAFVASASLIYFYAVHARSNHWSARISARLPSWLANKELAAALLITAGCILPSCARFHPFTAERSAIWLFWTPCLYLVALMWLNCWSIATWESAVSEQPNPRAQSGQPRTIAPLKAALLLASSGMLLALLAPTSYSHSAALLACGGASALLLALLDRLRTQITPLALRATADLVMLTPLFLLLR